MMTLLLIIIPFLAGAVAFFIRNDFVRRRLIVACSGIHLCCALVVGVKGAGVSLGRWFVFDAVGTIFLMITSVLFFGASMYGVSYLADESRQAHSRDERSRTFSPEAVFSGCFLLFLSTMTMVIAGQHMAIIWVGIEATTLASAPLLYFHRTKRSLEATWKYLLICSVGIAIALLGVFFLAVAQNNSSEMFVAAMVNNAATMNVPWLEAAFLLLFVGYGTKMGLAPFHTWLPDAHSEAPSVVSALLSGALLNCAFLGIVRAYQVCAAAGLAAYCRELFVVFGLVSIVCAAVFILGQTDYKRMLAYSSIEHMGIIVLGMGLGAGAVPGAIMNMLGHSLTKAGLFFVAGNILSHFKTKKIAAIHGLAAGQTWCLGVLWMGGFLLITGMPPSAIFMGKFLVLKEALSGGHYWVAFVFLAALALVFIGMARIFVAMTQGVAAQEEKRNNSRGAHAFWRLCVPAIFFIFVVCVGVYVPGWLASALGQAAKQLGGF